MALFKRRSTPEGAEDPDEGMERSDASTVDDLEDSDEGSDDDATSTARPAYDRTDGPFDESESDVPTRTSHGSISAPFSSPVFPASGFRSRRTRAPRRSAP